MVFAVAEAQRALGAEPTVLGVRDPTGAALGEAVLAPALGPIALGYAPSLGAALSASKPALVHLHGLFTWPSVLASRWAHETRKPTVVSPHGMLEPWALANSAWKKRAFRWLVEDRNLARARCLHALCAAEAANLRQLGLRNPIAVIPNAVDLAKIPSQPDRAAFAALHPELRGRRTVLFLGRVHPKKGLIHLLDAWHALRAEGGTRGWALVIAGPDQLGHAAEVARHASALGLEDEVLLVGPLYGTVKEAALAGAAGFVLPSFSEGFSMAVLEAMAWRLPVLISRPCNLDVEAPGAGLLCDPDRVSVAAQLRKLLGSSEAELRAMGERGRAEVARRYTWPLVAAQLLEVYRWLFREGGQPDTVEVLR
jgi:poly(glycerol-phosphate) alpha-glucosyltransferase